jgi:hypothetical protein
MIIRSQMRLGSPAIEAISYGLESRGLVCGWCKEVAYFRRFQKDNGDHLQTCVCLGGGCFFGTK